MLVKITADVAESVSSDEVWPLGVRKGPVGASDNCSDTPGRE